GLEPKTILTLLLILIAAGSAVCVVAFSNAVRSALCLVVNFFTLAFLYFTLNAELLGITQIIVYTGAIMVLFLFVVMLLNLGRPDLLTEKFDLKRPMGILFGFGLFAIVLLQVVLPLQGSTTGSFELATQMADKNPGGPEAIGRALFTHYAWPFEIVSVLLLIGIVGSILLAKRRI
ncbi:MAG TPA: NADH-quinone oxidoreductase subunit J, partial [Fimbriimonadaceae bacterium]|nr:NADH-quinone oxidoreductase subunit J [Fimbriimonadaceae bacterium]